MPHRRPFVGGNWKMNTNRASAGSLARAVAESMEGVSGVDVAVFPPFPYLLTVREALAGSPIALGAQDAYHEKDGAFTGEVSLAMLTDCGVTVVLAGHSERRHVIGEGDELVNAKARAILDAGLECILFVGETLEQREAGQTDRVNERQLRLGLAGVTHDQMSRLTIAYEPVWAIGTGKVATPDDAQEAQSKIRTVLSQLFSDDIAAAVRIQYGGSLKAANAAPILSQPDVDGGLVGGASLDAEDFAGIVRAAAGAG